MNKIRQFKILTKKILLITTISCCMGSFNFAYSAAAADPTDLHQIINEKRITIDIKNKPLKDILYEIQNKSGISFLIKEISDKNLPQSLSLTVKNETIKNTLNQLFAQTSFTYEIVGSTVTIIDKKVSKSSGTIYKIKGRVVAKSDSKPIAGATVLIKGTTKGAISDATGDFSLEVKSGDILEISFTGKKPELVTIAGEKEIVIPMEDTMLSMEEVVVTGIFERRSGTFTGSATSFKADDLKRVGNQNVFSSLRNLDPSLMIFDNLEFGSDPNKNPKMTLRGSSSFDLNSVNTSDIDIKGTYGNDPNAPLFILDGFEASIQKIMDLDMNRIESLTILKDASAKAIYGAKAANGVIVIETKKTGANELRVSYSGSLDVQIPDLTSYNMTNSTQKLELEKRARLYKDDNYSDYIEKQAIYNQKLSAVISGIDTDWLSKPLRSGIGTKHYFNIETGTQSFKAIADFSYNNVNGVMKGSKRTTYSGNISLSYRHKKFLFKNILSFTSNIAEDSPYGEFYEYVQINPYYSPYDKDGRLLKNLATSIFDETEQNNRFIANPLYNAQLNTIKEQRYIDMTNTTYVEWLIMDGLKATGRFGVTEKRNNADEFYPSNHLRFYEYAEEDYFRRGSYQENTGKSKSLSGDVNVQYSKQFGDKHYLFANGGFNLSEDCYQETIHQAEGFPNDRMNNIIFAKQYVKDSKPKGVESTIRNIGVLGVLNYSYDNRYLFDASYRVSASSQYGANNRWGQFWSTGIGWNLHNEDFLKEVTAITNLKLRGSVGYTGSQNSGAYDAMATYIYNLDRTYRGNLGSYLKGMRNENLKWQHRTDYNVGVDLNIKRRFMLTFDYYTGITENTIIDMTTPPSYGFSTVKENAGKIENRGFDIRTTYIAWQRVKDNSSLSIMLNVSRNTNKIKEISDTMKEYNERQDALANSYLNNKPVNKYYDGVSMDAIWAVRSLGIDPANGRELYLDKDGNPTYYYSASNQMVLGDKLPKFHGTAGLYFQYKGVGLNLSFRYQYGAKMYNQTLVDKVENANIENNVDIRMYEGVWREVGDKKPYKAMGSVWVEELRAYKAIQTQPTSRFVQKRNEFSLSNLAVSYDFCNFNFIKNSKMQALKLSFYMNDVFMISSIKVERGTYYPFARSFNFAVNATF